MTQITTAVTLSDLIGVPYKEHGRDLNGLDCYGLAIIAVDILTGKKLNDVWYDESHDPALAALLSPTLNVKKTSEIKAGNLLEMTFNDRLHIGVILNKNEFIHATKNGVKISHLRNAPIVNIYEVI